MLLQRHLGATQTLYKDRCEQDICKKEKKNSHKIDDHVVEGSSHFQDLFNNYPSFFCQ